MGINGLYASRKYYNQCEGPKSNTKSTTKPKLNRGIHAAECFRKTRDVYGHSHRSHNTGSGNGIDTNINKRVDDTVKNANNTKYKSLKNISKSRVNGDRNNTKGNEEKERGEDNKKYDKYVLLLENTSLSSNKAKKHKSTYSVISCAQRIPNLDEPQKSGA
ncbi:hypothetical protein AX774_g3906 [Zancudomyces culisetae]|uniref:Uncharacterized protein n=1 Tax=Zancudomyces culisetae TaxID=1213189 RepID=A0A1R1PNT1_ZANCU|nr:hypothetical protein AX774_g3906 [Zancudomyces culisetae]|eukprot:OMH82601.1 hypothetical protein AX774_g3906 [Zancudomyces culisetae]